MAIAYADTVEDVQYGCRFLRHAWEPFKPVEFHSTSMWRRSIHLRCLRCNTIRHDALSPGGAIVARRYEYADGYRFDPDDDRPTADDIRLWMLKRNQRLGLT